MPNDFLKIASTPGVKAAQEANGSGELWKKLQNNRETTHLTEAEMEFIKQRDSFYMATVSESGWPYVQHRGGPAGFLHLIDDKTLAFADFRGSRQYISVGNLMANDRAALILMDCPNRRRLKIYAHVEERNIASDPDLAARLTLPGYKAKPERILLLHLQAFDWNCPQHISPRFTEAELQHILAPVRDRIAQLEAENAALREKLGVKGA